jgi:hypothetical protein
MIGDKENKRLNKNEPDAEFKRYRILVKIFHTNKVEQQNLEIFTTGLQQLLELRRIHAISFMTCGFEEVLDSARNN